MTAFVQTCNNEFSIEHDACQLIKFKDLWNNIWFVSKGHHYFCPWFYGLKSQPVGWQDNNCQEFMCAHCHQAGRFYDHTSLLNQFHCPECWVGFVLCWKHFACIEISKYCWYMFSITYDCVPEKYKKVKSEFLYLIYLHMGLHFLQWLNRWDTS